MNFIAILLVLFNQISPPTNIIAKDAPDDGGGSIIVNWQLSADDELLKQYKVYRSRARAEFEFIGITPAGMTSFIDDRTEDGVEYRYKVAATKDDESAISTESNITISSPQWFNKGYTNVFIGMVLFSFCVILFIYRARMGKELFVRRIAGLQAVDEAVGRATEMGRPILFVPGTGLVDNVATIASLNILGEVAKKTAQYGTPLIVPNRDPIVYTVAREVVKESYTQVGRPDAFDPYSVFFVTNDQFGFAAAVDGIMLRERPATNFLLGYFMAESLILAETGAFSGAVQIAGTDAVSQLPFFVTACDYTLIGEELYAASAYLSREPLLLGALKGQDVGKLVAIILLILGSILGLLTKLPVAEWFG